MRVIPYGAAGGVTGSCYLVETKRAKILVDCGIFQGFTLSESANRVPGGLDPSRLNAVVLTHAHLDHCGRLPLFVKAGFSNPIYATEATIEVAKLILLDSAHIQEADAIRAEPESSAEDETVAVSEYDSMRSRAEAAEALASRRWSLIQHETERLREEKADIEEKIASAAYIALRPWLRLKLAAVEAAIRKLEED